MKFKHMKNIYFLFSASAVHWLPADLPRLFSQIPISLHLHLLRWKKFLISHFMISYLLMETG